MESHKIGGMIQLHPYQIEGANWLSIRRFALLADEMGLGKSAQAITAAVQLKSKRILVVCPASVKVNWQREFLKFGNRRAHVVGSKIAVASDIVITNYEQVTNKLSTYTSLWWDLIIFDESHFLKDPAALRTQAVFGKGGLIHTARRIWCLSGTPAPNHAGELWCWLFAFGLTCFSYDAFVQRYCSFQKPNKYGPPRPTGTNPKHIHEVAEALDKLSLRRLKRDVLKDLPSIQFDTFQLEEPKGDPLAGYPELKERMKEELELLQAKIGMALNIDDDHLLEILSLFSQSVSSLRRYHGIKKMGSVASVIEQELTDRAYDKIVLFCVHSDVAAFLENKLKKFGAVKLIGETPVSERQRIIDKFQTDPATRVFIGNIKAAGTGITLTAASNLAFVEYDWVPGNNKQAADRVHRIGQTLPVSVRFFSLQGIDSYIAEALARKTAEISTFIAH